MSYRRSSSTARAAPGGISETPRSRSGPLLAPSQRELGDFLRSAAGEASSLRSFWSVFAKKLFATQAPIERQSTDTAVPSTGEGDGLASTPKFTRPPKVKPHPTLARGAG